MAYVYSYVPKGKKAIDYIGRAKDAVRLMKRIKEHQERDHLPPEKYDIDIFYVPTVGMAETLETDMIYRCKPRMNVAKTSWGGIPGFANFILPKIKESGVSIDGKVLNFYFDMGYVTPYCSYVTDQWWLGDQYEKAMAAWK